MADISVTQAAVLIALLAAICFIAWLVLGPAPQWPRPAYRHPMFEPPRFTSTRVSTERPLSKAQAAEFKRLIDAATETDKTKSRDDK